MSEKRFEVSFDEKIIVDTYGVNKNTTEYDIHKSCDLINSLYEENEKLMKKLDYFQKRTIDLREQLDYAKDENNDLKFALQTEMSENRYKCPRCKSPLTFHHEDKETITFECTKCKYLVLARKC